MLTFLFLCAVGMAFAGLLAIPFMLFGLLFWVITLPFRLFFGLFGLFFALVIVCAVRGTALVVLGTRKVRHLTPVRVAEPTSVGLRKAV